jgi:hypothetical protein
MPNIFYLSFSCQNLAIRREISLFLTSNSRRLFRFFPYWKRFDAKPPLFAYIIYKFFLFHSIFTKKKAISKSIFSIFAKILIDKMNGCDYNY